MTPPRVLVADDNPISLRWLCDALHTLGCEPIQACDGAQALALAQEQACDLLLLDLRMPHLDGMEVLRRIREGSGPSRSTPAIASSAEVDAQLGARLHAAGFIAVLAKPMRLEDLRAALAIHLGESARAAGAFDDVQALRVAGVDAAIVSALRGLFEAELAALPAELEALAARADLAGLRARLHRLAASAGLCGAAQLNVAITQLRGALTEGIWPQPAIDSLLAACRETRAALAASHSR